MQAPILSPRPHTHLYRRGLNLHMWQIQRILEVKYTRAGRASFRSLWASSAIAWVSFALAVACVSSFCTTALVSSAMVCKKGITQNLLQTRILHISVITFHKLCEKRSLFIQVKHQHQYCTFKLPSYNIEVTSFCVMTQLLYSKVGLIIEFPQTQSKT